MLNDLEKILLTRGGGAVQRAHVVRHHGSYSVAEHSWGVAALLYQLFPQDFKRLVAFALFHDVPECLVGDVPTTAKDSCAESELENAINETFSLPQMKHLGERERAILKTCDRLDLYLWACEQLDSGNSWAAEVKTNLESIFRKPEGLLPEAHWVVHQVHERGSRPARQGLLRKIKESYGIE